MMRAGMVCACVCNVRLKRRECMHVHVFGIWMFDEIANRWMIIIISIYIPSVCSCVLCRVCAPSHFKQFRCISRLFCGDVNICWISNEILPYMFLSHKILLCVDMHKCIHRFLNPPHWTAGDHKLIQLLNSVQKNKQMNKQTANAVYVPKGFAK